MSDLIFDAPWWLPAIVALTGIALFVSGNRRTEAKVRNIGLAVIGLAAVLMLLKWFVDTPKKIALRESKELAAAVETGDWKKFRSLLTPDVGLRVLTGKSAYSNADQLTVATQNAAEGFRLRAIHIQSMLAEQTGPLVTVTLNLMTEQEQAGIPMLPSSWEFDFKQTSDGWKISEIRALKIDDMPSDEIEKNLPRGR